MADEPSDAAPRDPGPTTPAVDPAAADAIDAATGADAPAAVGASEPDGGDAAQSPPQLKPPKRKSLLHNMSALLASQAVTWTLSTIVTVIVPRRVGPEAIGGYRIATSIWAVLSVVIAFGTPTLITLEVAREQRSGRVELGPPLVIRMVAYVLSWIPLLVFLFAVGYPTEVLTLCFIVGAGTLVTTLGDVPRAALSGLERLDLAAAGDVALKLAGTILTVAVVIVTDDIRVIACVSVVSSLVYLGVVYRALRKLVRITLDWSLRSARAAVKRAAPFFLIAVTRVVYNQADVVIMSFLVTRDEIGWYGTADSLFGTFLFVPGILMTSLFPVLARTHAEDPNAVKVLLQRSFNGLTLLAVPVGLGVVIIADQLSSLLFGPRFDGTGPVLAVYGVVLIFTFLSILLGYYAVAVGRQRFWNVVMLVAIPMTVVLDLIFVPWTHDRFDNGAIGGALAYVVTESMMVAVGIWRLAPNLASRKTLERAVKSLLAGAVMVAVCWPLRDQFIAVTVLVGAVVFVTVFLLLRPLDDDEKQMVRRVRRRLPGPLGVR
jgi:O-antigen/teichoic acid export membrane protein